MQNGRFGTLGGVFTPCTLTILGVIMFLRFGQIVGNSGVLIAIGVVLVAKTITTLTALSLSAISTNTQVKGGGAYYVISRSLGAEFGGAIGIVFFLSQAISVAMYVLGFTEALRAAFPGIPDSPRLISSIVLLVVFACVYVGAGWTIKLQFGILAILAASIGAFALGAFETASFATLTDNLQPGFVDGENTLTMFALFFPAATGIMAGANMSGDLKDPGRSIPRGTLGAIAVTAAVYIGFAVLLGASADRSTLQTDTMIVSQLSVSPTLIVVGIFAATLSSALGSMMGAPRILQALAKDRLFKGLLALAKGSGKASEPRRATIVSFAIAECGILVGDLNAIAPVITMFFMITYGALNFATFQEAFSRNPSYRPTFRFSHWTISLLGAVSCLVVMFFIDPLWAALSVAAMVCIYQFLSRQNIQATWGDVQSGAAFERARRNLLVLESIPYHPKNWRPVVLALGAGKEDRLQLAVYCRWLAGPHGLLILGQVIEGDATTYLERQASHHRVLRKFILEHGLEAFPSVTIAENLSSGVSSLVQCCGLGSLKANLVTLGWSDDPDRRDEMIANLRTVSRLGRSTAVLRIADGATTNAETSWDPPSGPIDVWWRGQQNGPLMVLLAHMVRLSDEWSGRVIRLRRMIPKEAGREDTLAHLQEVAREGRIPCETEVFVGTDFRKILTKWSGDSALVILGFQTPPLECVDEASPGMVPRVVRDGAFLDNLDELTRGIPRVLLVHSAGDMNLHD